MKTKIFYSIVHIGPLGLKEVLCTKRVVLVDDDNESKGGGL